jgi:hypothetical protein
MKKLILLAVIAVSFSAFARNPAVEPVSGISIDHYNDVPPSEGQGFDWNNKKQQKSVKTKNTQSKLDVDRLPQQEITDTTGADLTPAFILFFMLVLPFGIWFFLLGKLEEPEVEVGFDDEKDNMLAFPSKSNKDEDGDDDDFDIPKAS